MGSNTRSLVADFSNSRLQYLDMTVIICVRTRDARSRALSLLFADRLRGLNSPFKNSDSRCSVRGDCDVALVTGIFKCLFEMREEALERLLLGAVILLQGSLVLVGGVTAACKCTVSQQPKMKFVGSEARAAGEAHQ